MVKRNPHFAKLKSGYLFPEINKRKQAFLKRCPDAKLISLGIGDTTQPLAAHVASCLHQASAAFATPQGYFGYGPEQGELPLRKSLAEVLYKGLVAPEEVFVSDGAKCDIGRLQILFGSYATIAVQNPTYPVYVDTGIMVGQTERNEQSIVYMPCLPKNDFFPDLQQTPRTDLIYFCSPNNPTGAVASYRQLEELVAFAKRNHSIIIFDSAYASYIRDSKLPRSIYEIPGAHEVAIEVGSFSKMAGFTGLRLGWSIIPEELQFEGGGSVKKDWERIQTTFFNGASRLIQKGGLAALEVEGLTASQQMADYYMGNAQLIRRACEQMGLVAHGGEHAPYVWVEFPQRDSWEVFEEILEQAHVVTTPGSGFGSAGQGFLRLSAFGQRHDVEEALQRLQQGSFSSQR